MDFVGKTALQIVSLRRLFALVRHENQQNDGLNDNDCGECADIVLHTFQLFAFLPFHAVPFPHILSLRVFVATVASLVIINSVQVTGVNPQFSQRRHCLCFVLLK